jgi:hypothetical protein
MIEELFGKAAGSSESPSELMPQPVVIPFYPHRIRCAGQPIVIGKSRQEAVPIVTRYRIIGNSWPSQPFPQLFCGFQVPIPGTRRK